QTAAMMVKTFACGQARDQAIGNVGRERTNGGPPAALTGAGALPASAQPNALRSIVSVWTQSDPTAAAQYVASLPAGKTQDEAVAAVANRLGANDPQQAVLWAQKLPPGTARQNALNTIVSQWAGTDPRAAADSA